MSNTKPLISILMAIYEPNLNWLRDQLKSLNDQNYPRLSLYIIDDCSPTVPFDEIVKLVTQCVTNFNFSISRNESNIGSTKTFEMLTKLAEGDFFAYCDQDDIWIPEKLSILCDEIINRAAFLVCSDMYIIDANGSLKASSITQVRRHHVFYSGYNLSHRILVSNFIAGCTMLVRASVAKEAVPFCPYMVHDHYLALYCSNKGLVVSLQKQLIYYRIHNNNQTLVLSGVTDKKSYYEKRIVVTNNRLNWLNDNLMFNDNNAFISNALAWGGARETWYHNKNLKSFYDLWKCRHVKFSETMFELVSLPLPNFLFRFLVFLYKNNVF
ncbi:glycosyltransferase [Succinimonas amylolytica]|uniref:glycosyltransferase n=1 Tax=Succinimonas amylolytica TaxID=83769 RepID=UPI00039C151A|nr:glycosyltransferase [Succinimonas amylolytica]